ncbi:MAG: hypothetical protein DHS20C05_10400 [Hyphococcus sp.]|nr:MAG: hypothetical protein DHS20C05_10400 [Marinicaulis sp.]
MVLFPVILAALAFSFEFGRLFIAHHTTVNNVRAAVRYLSRSDLTAAQQDTARAIVRTGQPSGATAPDWMTGANITITPSQSTFSDTDFRTGGQVIRIQAEVNFPLSLFGFINDGRTGVPITIVEDIRHIGD